MSNTKPPINLRVGFDYHAIVFTHVYSINREFVDVHIYIPTFLSCHSSSTNLIRISIYIDIMRLIMH